MGHKVFVSYKYKDNDVASLDGYYKGTARDYVDYLQDHKFSGDDLNKAENDDEDLSEFKDETIRTKLKDKIWDSSVTLVLISPNMVEQFKGEKDQWIPWEIAYSLRTQTKANSRSLPNALIAVALPDRFNSYKYFITHWTYTDENSQKEKNVTTIHTDQTFRIVQNNMFNQKNPITEEVNGETVYFGECSYMIAVEWEDFISNIDSYINRSLGLRDKIGEYNPCKEI
ncbi:hypothetical protein G8J22_00658 [Lentilactobacillus hilgardii]|uniref:TIR domain-containing protein n=1 Tax=Lentilactobacillus hilgardii TaxID=1588 RepID=UPI0002EC49F2|nr:TIR domain-containing protein [Lentilactobacillus hilgardii]MCT3396338.1 hypothetical protein [Lentilactobacillus hilgardii]QIR08724.1 hypothetical protein G8J22_00658 [Lentilactobacillus hilgardii]